MLSRLPRHAVPAIAGICIVLAAALEAQQPRSCDRYTEPIQIYKIGLGTFTKPMSSTRSAGVLRPGLSDDVFVAKPGRAVVSRGVEARRRVRDLLLGRSVGLGIMPECADDGRRVSMRVPRQKALSLKGRATPKERALIDAIAVRYVEKFDGARRVEQDRAYADAMQKVAAQFPTISKSPRSTPTHSSCSSRAVARDVNVPASIGCTRSSRASSRATSTIPVPVTLRPRHRVHHRARARGGVRRVPGAIDSRRQPHQPHAVARGTRSAAGATRYARTSRPGTRIERRRSGRASRSIPSTTCTCCSTRVV